MSCGSLKVNPNLLAYKNIFTVFSTSIVILRLNEHISKILKSFQIGFHLRLTYFRVNLEEFPLEEADLEVDNLDDYTSD